MESIPDIIWVLIGLLLFSVLLVVGFNTTLGDFLKTKLAKTIVCGIALALGLMAFGFGLSQIIAINSVMPNLNWEKLLPFIALATLGGAIACISAVIWWYKVKDIKPAKPKKR